MKGLRLSSYAEAGIGAKRFVLTTLSLVSCRAVAVWDREAEASSFQELDLAIKDEAYMPH